jgi:hypothetical protein
VFLLSTECMHIDAALRCAGPRWHGSAPDKARSIGDKACPINFREIHSYFVFQNRFAFSTGLALSFANQGESHVGPNRFKLD